MEIKELQYIIAIAEAGSLSSAAERLYLSQQGLSSAVLRLERELGYPLFIRSAAGVTLTERGEAFCRGARPVVSSFLAFSRDVASPDGRPKISIVCTFNLIPKCPRPMQRLLLCQDAEYAVETKEGFYSECENLAETGQCSFGICSGPVDESRLFGEKLFDLEQCFVVNKRHPLAGAGSIRVAQLKDEPLIIPHHQARANAIIRQFMREAGFEPRVALECDRSMEIISIVKRNPEMVARIFIKDALEINDPDVAILRLSDVEFKLSICLIWRKRPALTGVERKIKNAILNCVNLAEPT